MREDVIRKALNEFDVRQYIENSRAVGRLKVEPGLRLAAAELYEKIARFRPMVADVSWELDTALQLAERALFSEWFLHKNNNVPRYAAYVNLKVLNWSLRVNRRTPLNEVWTRCRRMVRLLVQDLMSFEVWSLAGFGSWQQENFDPRAVRNRVDALRALLSQIEGSADTFPNHYVGESPEDWFTLALDESREAALLHLTLLPQTAQHDEVLFLRTIHISECLFWGVLTAVGSAVEALKTGSMEAAAGLLGEANWFAKLLLPLFHAFKTMPVEHFRNFREQTGNASAIQSRTYQLMQIACQGVDEKKVEALSQTPEVSDLLLCAHPFYVSLRSLMAALEGKWGEGAEDVKAQAEALDRHLYTWRCVHLGIARQYLADLMDNSSGPGDAVGTGGTSGPPYLAAHYRHMILKQSAHHAPWAMVEIMPHVVARPLLGQSN